MTHLNFDQERAADPHPDSTSTHKSERTPHQQYDIYYRQISGVSSIPGPATSGSPPATSSSYDYWWPYPPGGVVATSSTTSVATAGPTSVAVAQSSFQYISSSMPNASTSSSLAVSSNPPSISSNSSTITGSSTSNSQSIISINATIDSQSASPTLVVYPKTNTQGSKAPTYLILVFVIVGVVLGCIAAWIGWGCITRKPRLSDFREDDLTNRARGRRRPRRSELEVGPPYCPSLSDKNMLSEEDNAYEKAPLYAGALTDAFSWRGMDIDGGQSAAEKDDSERAYLVPPTSVPFKTGSRSKSTTSRPTRGPSRAPTVKTAVSMSVYSQVGEDEDEFEEEHDDKGRNDDESMSFLDEFESDYDPRSPRLSDDRKLQQKSTPQSTATSSTGRVVSVSRRRPKQHNRQESDLRLEDVARVQSGDDNCRIRELDLSRTRTERSTRTTSTVQTGFRMMEGSPLPTPAASLNASDDNGFFWSKPVFGGTKSAVDRYTVLPSRSGSRSRSSSPVKQISRSGAGKRRPLPRTDSKDLYPLPKSPPLVCSPKLDNALCFTPVLESEELEKEVGRGRRTGI